MVAPNGVVPAARCSANMTPSSTPHAVKTRTRFTNRFVSEKQPAMRHGELALHFVPDTFWDPWRT